MSLQKTLSIDGGGVAALATAALLADAGFQVGIDHAMPATGPVVVLQASTIQLLADIFGSSNGIFIPSHQLRRRYVLWGNARPVMREEVGLVVTLPDLQRGLMKRLFERWGENLHPTTNSFPTGNWRIIADVWPTGSPASPAVVADHMASTVAPVGQRVTLTAWAHFTSTWDTRCAWVENTPMGWLFAVSTDETLRGWVQLTLPRVTCDPLRAFQQTLSQSHLGSRLVAYQLEPNIFPTAPRFRLPPYGDHCLAVGRQALCLDPLHGDGIGVTLQTALLATAIVQASERYEYVDLLRHYQARLQRTFTAHLEGCLSFYGAAVPQRTWQDEIAQTQWALSALQTQVMQRVEFTLQGRKLMRIGQHPGYG